MRNILFILLLILTTAPASYAADNETVYERVMRTQTLRCGYGQWDPYITKDPNTGEFSGIFYDYVNELGKALSLKIEWTEETDWGTFGQALNSERIDAFCLGVWQNASRAREMDFIRPIFYSTINTYARADDSRFDKNINLINSEKVTVATVDGEMGGIITASDFPKAKTAAAPQMAGQASLMQNIATGKADIAFTDPATAAQFMKANPNKVKAVPSGKAIRVFGNTIAIKKDEYPLKAMLDSATIELLQSGQIEKIIKKYEKNTGDFPRVAKPYEASQ